jgi:hypothetical protein
MLGSVKFNAEPNCSCKRIAISTIIITPKAIIAVFPIPKSKATIMKLNANTAKKNVPSSFASDGFAD